MNSVLGFEDGEIHASAFTGAQGSILPTGVDEGSITIVANVSGNYLWLLWIKQHQLLLHWHQVLV